MEILLPILAIGGMGLIFGGLLAIAAKVFEVKKDERIPLITECLPGANCGGCGFAGCSAAAEAIVNGEASVGCCPVGGDQTAKQIAEIMGVQAEETEKMVAFVMCSGSGDVAKRKYEENEDIDCFTAHRLSGGMKVCSFGCLGFGSCVKKCKFGALSIQNGVAVVDRDKCTNCGACIKECPRNVIKRVPYSTKAIVACVSQSKGKDTRSACEIGCLGCGICVKNCESNAIVLENNFAVIDSSKCIGCGICAEKCPRKIIKMLNSSPEICVVRKAETL